MTGGGLAGDNYTGLNMYGSVRKLRVIKPFDPWKSRLCTCRPKYSLHPYTGCSHFCLYCYASSYIGYKPSRLKKNILRSVIHDVNYINRDLVVEMSSSSDPYPPLEEWMLVTRSILKILCENNVKVLITTKSHIVTRDADILSRMKSAVMITITTLDRDKAKIIEPGAPDPEKRLKAVEYLSDKGIPVGVRIDPIIPGVNDDPVEIDQLIKTLSEHGVKHIVTSTYKVKYDNFKRMTSAFPGLKSFWRKLYFKDGEWVNGYYYLPRDYRYKLLKPVYESALKHGLTIANCREGIPELFKTPSCDGQHLIGYNARG